MQARVEKKLSLISILSTFFIDNLGWAIVFPLFAPYFLDPQNNVFAADVSERTRTLILGFFLTAFSLGQFLGAPIVGEYGDRYGRKRALLMSGFFTCMGLILTAWSLQRNYLPLLFLGRLMTGFSASSTSVCLAAISDLSETETAKVKTFGYLAVSGGLSFVLGAFVGGKLSDPSLNSHFSLHFPIWISAALTALNFCLVFLFFRETSLIDLSVQFSWLECFKNIQRALKTEKIKRIYAIYFLFIVAWTLLFQFIPVIAVQRYAFTSSNIGDLALFMGICWAIGSGYLNRMLVGRFAPLSILEGCLIGFAVLSAVLVLPYHLYWVLAVLGCCTIIGGLAWPLCNGMISNAAPPQFQGKILGMSQSVQSFAAAIAPALGGVAFKFYPSLPFLLGALACLASVIIYFSLKEPSA